MAFAWRAPTLSSRWYLKVAALSFSMAPAGSRCFGHFAVHSWQLKQRQRPASRTALRCSSGSLSRESAVMRSALTKANGSRKSFWFSVFLLHSETHEPERMQPTYFLYLSKSAGDWRQPSSALNSSFGWTTGLTFLMRAYFGSQSTMRSRMTRKLPSGSIISVSVW